MSFLKNYVIFPPQHEKKPQRNKLFISSMRIQFPFFLFFLDSSSFFMLKPIIVLKVFHN